MSASSSLFTVLIMVGLGASACDARPATPQGAEAEAPAARPAETQAAPLVTAGPPAVLTPEAADGEALQYAASVVQVQKVEDDAKLFGLAGGDPAMNGLHTYLAFYGSPDTDWTIFELGDFLDYTVLSSAPGRLELDIHESVYQEATASVGDRHRRVIVTWTLGTDETPPTALTVTPAR